MKEAGKIDEYTAGKLSKEEKKKIFKLLQNLVLSSKGGVQLERLNRKSGSAYVGCFEGPWLSFL